ncbi:MAG: 3-oxoacyl-[acyl-carrier-protein] reductase [Actinobacteria bacterium]|nr:3-oxoacyl-[acyl-carrier-protein] reductase [Actinomycetota bacterium]
MRLKDKISMVTGGARGIGKKICEKFLKEGAVVYLVDVNEVSGRETEAEFRSIFGEGRAFFFKADITNEEEVKKLVDKIVGEQGRIDILVNNAGITHDNLILRMSLDEWEKVIKVNLTGAFICSKYVVRNMVKERKGKIINISSIVGLHGNVGQCNYSSSKAGIVGLTKSLAKELAGRNITVNAIAPGYIETEMTAKLDERIKEKLLSLIPMGRLGSVDDVASVALFLASEDSNYITGSVINVDGGMGI